MANLSSTQGTRIYIRHIGSPMREPVTRQDMCRVQRWQSLREKVGFATQDAADQFVRDMLMQNRPEPGRIVITEAHIR